MLSQQQLTQREIIKFSVLVYSLNLANLILQLHEFLLFPQKLAWNVCVQIQRMLKGVLVFPSKDYLVKIPIS